MVGRADDYRVQRFFRLQQLAEIAITRGRWKPRPGSIQILFVHVAKRNDVHLFSTSDFPNVISTTAAYPNEGDV